MHYQSCGKQIPGNNTFSFYCHRQLMPGKVITPSSKLIISIVFVWVSLLIVLSSCISSSNPANQGILTTAWQSCDSATGTPTGEYFTGKVVLVWNIHENTDYQHDSSIINPEQLGSLILTNSSFFILGNYDRAQYYNNNYSLANLFTHTLDSAGALLCISVYYNDIETCSFSGSANTPAFTIIFTQPVANAKLVKLAC